MTVWIAKLCRFCLSAMHDRLSLYGKSGLRI